MNRPPLRLYNSLSRTTETFVPLDPADVRVYSCGPTVYGYAHLGNLRAYVFTDTLARTLRWRGLPLTHVINITDVGHLTSDADAGDDKMEAAARASGQDIWAIARHYTEAFKRDLAALNIVEPTRFPLATDHIPEMIAFTERIAERHCYQLDSGLYFDTSTVPHYGALAGARDDAAHARIEAVSGKRHPQDFAIWRRTPSGETRQMEWDSPWGRGAPGWHLECSVMSRKYLGDRFDIHTGGIDHREIHHPNEIAQNQAYCDCADTGATFWMHNNFLVDRTGKMSKSAGGTLTLAALAERGLHPLAYRLMCLQAQYRSELEFSWENLVAAQARLKRLVQAVETLRAHPQAAAAAEAPAAPIAALDEAMANDLATPQALVVLEQLVRDKTVGAAARLAALPAFDAVLGLDLVQLTRAALRVRPAGATLDEAAVEEALAERRAARAAKDFARSDALRDALADGGVEVMDGDPLGWDWRLPD